MAITNDVEECRVAVTNDVKFLCVYSVTYVACVFMSIHECCMHFLSKVFDVCCAKKS